MEKSIGVPIHLSPKYLAVLSCAAGLIIMLIPKSVYEGVLSEPDLMFGNIEAMAFVAICVIGFIGGYRLHGQAFGSKSDRKGTYFATSLQQTEYISIASLLTSIAICILGLLPYLKNISGLTHIFEQGSGEDLRHAMLDSSLDSGFSMANLFPICTAVNFWSLYRYLQVGGSLSRIRRTKWRWVLTSSIGLAALTYLIAMQRSLLLPFSIGLLMIASALRWHTHGSNIFSVLKWVGAIIISSVLLFVLTGYLRTAYTSMTWLNTFFGYLPASYNRLAAALDGSLVPPVSGASYYSFRFLWFPPLIRRFLPVNELGNWFGLNLPPSIYWDWLQQFSAVEKSGLLPFFIWPTAYGYCYYDFGWWSWVYFCALGFISRPLWLGFLTGQSFAIVMYPVLAYSIILWSTDNLFSYTGMVIFVGAGLTFSWLDRLALIRGDRVLSLPGAVVASLREKGLKSNT